jgi:hypothetical protein
MQHMMPAADSHTTQAHHFAKFLQPKQFQLELLQSACLFATD